MKSKIILAGFLSFALIASAFAGNPKLVTVTREIPVTSSFNKIVVDNNINVVLVQDDNTAAITISGDEKNIKHVEAAITKDELTISSKGSVNGKKITVYIPVKNLATIELLNGSSVSGQGVLRFSDLTVIISHECRVALNTIGKLTIKSNEDCDFIYEKNEKYKVLTVAEKVEKEEKYKVLTATLLP